MRNYIFLVTFPLYLIFLCSCQSCRQKSVNDWIQSKIGLKLPFEIENKDVISKDRDWFIAIKLSPQKINDIYKNICLKNFTGWKHFSNNLTLGVKQHYRIDENDNIYVNYRKGSTVPWSYIAIFLDIDKNVIIFVDGTTFGR